MTSRGFVELERNAALKKSIQEVALSELSRFIGQGVKDDRAGRGVSEAVSDMILRETGKDPIVMALLTEVMT